MAGQKIGIKLADGSFYPVMNAESREKKKFVLTTNHDYQEGVQIDFFLGPENASPGELRSIGGLRMSKIEPDEQGKPEVTVYTKLDEDGSLVVRAVDEVIGEEESKAYDLPLDEDEGLEGASLSAPEGEDSQGGETDGPGQDPWGLDRYAPAMTGEGPENFEEEVPYTKRKSRGNLFMAVGFVLIGLFLIGMLSFLFFRQFERHPQPPLRAEPEQALLMNRLGSGTIPSV